MTPKGLTNPPRSLGLHEGASQTAYIAVQKQYNISNVISALFLAWAAAADEFQFEKNN